MPTEYRSSRLRRLWLRRRRCILAASTGGLITLLALLALGAHR